MKNSYYSRTNLTPSPSQAKRTIAKSSKGHFVGELVYQLMGDPQSLAFESYLEYQAALCLIYMPTVVEVEEQIAPFAFRKPDGSSGTHFFDFRMTQLGGRRTAVAVKPEYIAQSYEFGALMSAIATAAIPEVAEEVCIITERNIHPTKFHNAKLFHAARRTEVEMDERICDALKCVSEPIRISSFLEYVGCFGAGFFSVARSIRFGHALNIDGGPIGNDSLILNGQAI